GAIPEIIKARAIARIEQEHRSQRCNADAAQVYAREQSVSHIHLRLASRRHLEMVSNGDRGAFQQGMDGDRARIAPWLLDPEMGEGRKLLAFRLAGAQRQSACRQAIVLSAAHRAKIAGALEDQ